MPTLFENMTSVTMSIQINADQNNIARANLPAGMAWHVDLKSARFEPSAT